MPVSLPVTLPLHAGYYVSGVLSAKGLLRLEADRLVLEYRTQDRSLQTSATFQIVFPVAGLSTIEWKPGFFKNRMVLEVASLSLLENVPGADGSRLELQVERAHRHTAAHMASQVHLALSESRLRALGD